MGAGSQLRSSEPALTICSFILFFYFFLWSLPGWRGTGGAGWVLLPTPGAVTRWCSTSTSPTPAHIIQELFFGGLAVGRGGPHGWGCSGGPVRALLVAVPESAPHLAAGGDLARSVPPAFPPSVMTKADSKASAGLELSLAESCEILGVFSVESQPFPGLLLTAPPHCT